MCLQIPHLAEVLRGRGRDRVIICNRYTLTGCQASACFWNSERHRTRNGDGLTDAYEKLTGITDPPCIPTDGTGMADGWKSFYFGHTGG